MKLANSMRFSNFTCYFVEYYLESSVNYSVMSMGTTFLNTNILAHKEGHSVCYSDYITGFWTWIVGMPRTIVADVG